VLDADRGVKPMPIHTLLAPISVLHSWEPPSDSPLAGSISLDIDQPSFPGPISAVSGIFSRHPGRRAGRDKRRLALELKTLWARRRARGPYVHAGVDVGACRMRDPMLSHCPRPRDATSADIRLFRRTFRRANTLAMRFQIVKQRGAGSEGAEASLTPCAYLARPRFSPGSPHGTSLPL
jgi:hypothetical protein